MRRLNTNPIEGSWSAADPAKRSSYCYQPIMSVVHHFLRSLDIKMERDERERGRENIQRGEGGGEAEVSDLNGKEGMRGGRGVGEDKGMATSA